jgi:hypothetical protein
MLKMRLTFNIHVLINSTAIKWAEIIPRFHKVQTCWANAAGLSLMQKRDTLIGEGSVWNEQKVIKI